MAKKKNIKKNSKKVVSKSSKKPVSNPRSFEVKKSLFPVSPLGDRVLIKELAEEEMFKTSASGIIIPDSAKDEGGKRGKVVAVGEGKIVDGKLVPLSVLPGQIVLYSWGDKIKVGGEEFVIVREGEIIAIVN